MTINWENNITIYGNCPQTTCGTFHNFSATAYVDVVNSTITSTSVQEIEWIIPFVMYGTSSAEQLIGHRNIDWYFPYFYSNGRTPIVYNGQGNQVGDTLNLNQKYWLKITRSYANNTAKYDWSSDGVTYTTYTTIPFTASGLQDGDPYRFGNAVYDNELNKYFNGSIFLAEVKCKVDGVNVPIHKNSAIYLNSDITLTGDFVISEEGYVSGFKPDTYITLGMSEISGANPSSTLSMIFPIVLTSFDTTREAQLGWKSERWVIPKLVGNQTIGALYAYNNTTGSNIQVSPALTLNQLYYIKVDWEEGTGTRTYSYSTDGINFTQYTTFNDTSMASATPSGPIYIGMGNPNSGETAQWFTGELYLAGTQIYANGTKVAIVNSPQDLNIPNLIINKLTREQYDNITTPDPTQLYFTDSGLFIGSTEVANISNNRNIGEIVASTTPLTDAGLHLLDGALIDGSGIYSAFVTHIAGLVSDYPDLFDTEANWQQSVTTYGVCGKFVYDSVNNTVRLPKVTGIIEGTTDLTALGDLVEAGLPNITGWSEHYHDLSRHDTGGAFYSSDGISAQGSGGGYGTWSRLNINASRSSSIYGNSDTVQPQTIKAFYYIVIATSTKTDIEVDIDEIATDLNGKADVDLSNMSASQSAKNTIVSWGMPDYANKISFSNTPSYTAPSKGYMMIESVALRNDYQPFNLYINGVLVAFLGEANGAWNRQASGLFAVDAGDIITYTGYPLAVDQAFYPMKGAN